MPQLLGKTGEPRDWIYIWYARNGGAKGAEFTRNQRYKLYRTGKFYDIENDELEKSPLDPSKLSDDVLAIRDKLQAALDQYTDARPEKFANWKQNKKKKNTKK